MDNLILAYRSKFYDCGLKATIAFYKKNKGLLWAFIAFTCSVIVTMIYSVKSQNTALMLALMISEILAGIICDRWAVKHYQQYISRKKEHINDVTLFLKAAISEKDLFSKKHIEELIDRLSVRIDAGAPFNKFKSSLGKFSNVIVFPIVGYIAGLYTTNMRELGFAVILVWSVSIILLTGTLYFAGVALSQALQKIICRDYDAAKALREDLLDIKLLFFVSDK